MIKEIDYIFHWKENDFLQVKTPSLRLVNCQNSIFLKPDHCAHLFEPWVVIVFGIK